MRLDDLSVGQELPSNEEWPTRPQLFRYSAITWNPHRIHYDPEYATEVEDHPDVLVQAQLHGALIRKLVMEWLGTDGELRAFGWRNVGRAVPNRALHVGAEITDIDIETRTVQLEAWTETDDGFAATGNATVRLVE